MAIETLTEKKCLVILAVQKIMFMHNIGNASGIQHPKSINDAENGNQPGFEADRIMAETPVFKAGFQAIQGG